MFEHDVSNCGRGKRRVEGEGKLRCVSLASWMRRTPQGAPTEARKSEAKVTGLSQRRVRDGFMSLEERIARPRVERSVAEAYMLPPLMKCKLMMDEVRDSREDGLTDWLLPD
jgi:hypothetical protein